MRFSIIENGKVVNHAEAEADFAAAQGWIAAGDSRIGDTWNGVQFSAPVITLDEKKATLKKRLAELAAEKLSAGVVVNGLRISTTPAARGLLSLGKIGNKAQRKIVTEAGQRELLTAAQFDAVVLAVDNYGQGIMDRHYDLSAQIDACTTGAEVDAIDINVGWPT